mmetsp:Transcript_64096/g.177114  ORF Transcript_64096/g.177114 Transcript_64096/m.177114 type:complete len:285 (-) Transcript_64096:73-927(-)
MRFHAAFSLLSASLVVGALGGSPRFVGRAPALLVRGGAGPKAPDHGVLGEADAEDGPSEPENKFLRAVETLKANGHPADCPALIAFEAAAADESVQASATVHQDMMALWMQVRLAMVQEIKKAKGKVEGWERNLMMLGTEAAHFCENGKLSEKDKDAFFTQLRKEAGMREGAFKAKWEEFEAQLASQTTQAGEQQAALVLKALADPEFNRKVVDNLAEQEEKGTVSGNLQDFFKTEEAVEETRKQLQEALEEAVKSKDMLRVTQLATKMQQALENMLGKPLTMA